MIEIDNISFRVNTRFDGLGKYFIYNSPSCNESDIVLSGTTNIINGSSVVNINQPLMLNENISIKFIDIKECPVCENYNIIIPTGETTTTTTMEPISFNTYYLAAPRSINDSDSSGCIDIYDYCTSPGYTTVTTVYANTIDSTLESLLNKTLYTDTSLTTEYEGLGNNFRYAVSTISGLNTFTEGPSGYRLVTINESGMVVNIEVNPCDCEGNGGGPIV
jgi:hypothetical protein